MKIYQLMLSNIPSDFMSPLGLQAMTEFDCVEIQAELITTLTNKAGEPFAYDGMTPFAWLERHGVEVWSYFDAAWPSPPYNQLSDPRGKYDDVYWLRKMHTGEIHVQPEWQIASSNPDRPYTNAANGWYVDWAVDLMLDTGIRRWRFDDGQIHNKSPEVNQGWYNLYDKLRAAGCKVVVNGAWNISDPHAEDWNYPAIEHVDGCMVEMWAGHYDGQGTASGWWPLSENSFRRLAADWVAAGKEVVMMARWRAGDTHYFNDYDAFMQHYIDLAAETGAIFAPADENYRRSAWRNWFADYQDEDTLEELIVKQCDMKQTVLLNPDAALQKVIYAEGGVPVENEFNILKDGVTYIVQKSEFTGHQEERYHYADVRDYGNVTSFTKPS